MFIEVSNQTRVTRPHNLGSGPLLECAGTDMIEDGVVHVRDTTSASHPPHEIHILKPVVKRLVETALRYEGRTTADQACARGLGINQLRTIEVEIKHQMAARDRVPRPVPLQSDHKSDLVRERRVATDGETNLRLVGTGIDKAPTRQNALLMRLEEVHEARNCTSSSYGVAVENEHVPSRTSRCSLVACVPVANVVVVSKDGDGWPPSTNRLCRPVSRAVVDHRTVDRRLTAKVCRDECFDAKESQVLRIAGGDDDVDATPVRAGMQRACWSLDQRLRVR